MFNINDPQACKLYSARMFLDSVAKSYFGRNFMGHGQWPRTPVQLLTELTCREGDPPILYPLDIPLQGQGVYGDDKLQEEDFESLYKHKDTICIGKVRHEYYSYDKMTNPQQAHNLREEALKELADWFRTLCNQLSMQALSGRKGAIKLETLDPNDPNSDLFCNNAFKKPDFAHIIYGGDAKSLSTLKTDHTLTHEKLKVISTFAEVLGGGGMVEMQPLGTDGMKNFVLLMHPDSAEDLRKSTDPRIWEFIQEEARKAAEEVGSKSPIFKNAFGLIGNVLLHEHPLVPRFNDGGSTGNVPWSRTFLLGRQALTLAFGGAQPGCRFAWREGICDHGNQTWITASALLGIKRTTLKGKAFGMIAVDHALSKKPADS